MNIPVLAAIVVSRNRRRVAISDESIDSEKESIGIIGVASLLFGVLLIIALGAGLYIDVDNANHVKLKHSETRNFVLLDRTIPKHFYVDILDVETKKIYRRVYVSKHCNSWQSTAVIGKTYAFQVDTYLDDRTKLEYDTYRNLYSVLCQ